MKKTRARERERGRNKHDWNGKIKSERESFLIAVVFIKWQIKTKKKHDTSAFIYFLLFLLFLWLGEENCCPFFACVIYIDRM